MSSSPITISTLAAEGELQVSKFQKIALLLNGDEIESLFHFLTTQIGKLSLVAAHGKCKQEEAVMTFEKFCADYKKYVALLMEGNLPAYDTFASKFSNILTLDTQLLYAIPLSGERVLIKPKAPVIQMQPNQLQYCKEDGTFRSQVYGNGSITWGILFSYPQLFQNKTTYAIEPVRDGFINTALFGGIKRWTRDNTLPTRFIVDGKRTVTAIRLGKKCKWINTHPQLVKDNISVILQEKEI